MDDIDKTIAPQRFGDDRKENRFAVGELILGRYKVLAELGQGGMGVVYKCFDEVSGIQIALKALPPELSHNSLEMEDIRDNFQLVEKLHHPNIAAYKNLERDPRNGNYYLIMECVEGQELSRWLRAQRREGTLTLPAVLPIIRQVASALDYAHERQIIHRDIKPGNIMIGADGTIKVLDFGLAAQIHTSMTRVSMAYRGTSGTGPYMAPEQWAGQPQDAAADQYALAVLAYEMLAGHLPFESHDIAILREAVLKGTPTPIEQLPVSAWNAIKRAMNKDRKLRFKSCAEFANALGGAKIKGGVKDSGGSSRKKYAWGGIAAALLVIILVSYSQYQDHQKKVEAEHMALVKQEQELQVKRKQQEQAENLADMKRFYKEKKYDQAFACARKADQNSPEVQYYLALMYGGGMGTNRDEPLALKLLTKSAEQGYSDAQIGMGTIYELGKGGIPKDQQKALQWYRKAAEQGNASAQNGLGLTYEFGLGVTPDKEEAKKWYQKSADQGFAEAQYHLGMLYRNTNDPNDKIQKANREKGHALLVAAAKQGHSAAIDELRIITCVSNVKQIMLAQKLYALDYNGAFAPSKDVLVKQDYLKDEEVYHCSAAGKNHDCSYLFVAGASEKNSGDMPAVIERLEDHRGKVLVGFVAGYVLALDYTGKNYAGLLSLFKNLPETDKNLLKKQFARWDKGDFTNDPAAENDRVIAEYKELYDAKKYKEAFAYLQKADQSLPGVQFYLGVMNAVGLGTAKNEVEAAKWYRKAAEQGHVIAQRNLGLKYQYGEGVEKNETEAFKWFSKAAEQGNADSQNRLGLMYRYGHGVNKNEAEAIKWYLKAAAQNHASAQCSLGYMYNKGQGVTEDPAEAVNWYRKAAALGNTEALNNLGFMYESGRGVTENREEAIKYYQAAAAKGNEIAKNNLKRLTTAVKKVTVETTPGFDIQKKINEASAGSTIIIPSGKYTVDRIWVAKGKNITLKGAGRNSTIINLSEHIYLNKDGNLAIENCTINSSANFAILYTGDPEVLYSEKRNTLVISDCIINNNSDENGAAVSIDNAAFQILNSAIGSVNISNSYGRIKDTFVGNTNTSGISVLINSYVEIINSTVKGCKRFGINMGTNTAALITDCEISSNERGGIFIASNSKLLKINNSKIVNNRKTGVYNSVRFEYYNCIFNNNGEGNFYQPGMAIKKDSPLK